MKIGQKSVIATWKINETGQFLTVITAEQRLNIPKQRI